MMRRRRYAVLLRALILLVIVAGSVYAVHEFRRAKPIADLPTASAREGDFPVLVRCRGNLGARHSVQITAPVDAPDLTIIWLAPSGSDVKTGQTVIKFDRSRSEQDLKEKTAALQQAQATLDQEVAQARMTADQDKLDLETAQFTKEKAKLEASKQAIVSSIQGQESTVDFKVAEEKVRVQSATVDLHAKSEEAKIASLTRLRDETRNDLALTQHRLDLMDVRSPLNGIINYLPNYSQGWMNAQPFKVGDHAASGGALAEIPDLSTLQMESKLDEVDRGRIALGDAVLVHVDAFPEKTVQAKLSSVTPLTEESFEDWPPVRNFKAYAAIDHPDPRMRPGMNASADIVESKIAKAISVPAKAVFTRGGKPTVFVKKNGAFVPITVEVLARNPDEVAVKGIASGDAVALAEPKEEGNTHE